MAFRVQNISLIQHAQVKNADSRLSSEQIWPIFALSLETIKTNTHTEVSKSFSKNCVV